MIRTRLAFVFRCPAGGRACGGFRAPPPLVRQKLRSVALATTLFAAWPRPAPAESSLQYKYQEYREEADRIRVVSHYALAEVDLDALTRLRARGIMDTITGASPTGVPAPPGSNQVPLAQLEDVRHAVVADIARGFGDTTGKLEFAYSTEDDYLSRGYTLTLLRDLNQKNTQLQFGASYVDDSIRPVFFASGRSKLSRDFLIGVTQLLDANTTLTATASYGTSRGFLSDPYKLVRKTTEIAPGLSLDLTFPENRPNSREKFTGFLELIHMFENVRGSADISYRYLRDDMGVRTRTLEAAWLQRFGAHFIGQVFARFYRQSAAEFYFYDLNLTPIVPAQRPDGAGVLYSSDYRLSAFDATTLGFKAIYEAGDRWSIDATYERYDMQGRDHVTPQSAYATANVFTLGAKLWF